jgi:hypothetical protein
MDFCTSSDVWWRAFDLLIHVPRRSLWTSAVSASLPNLRAGSASAH